MADCPPQMLGTREKMSSGKGIYKKEKEGENRMRDLVRFLGNWK